ncbi:lytic murein transglycosylase, partial [Patescibacteria group bacterium]|nr:lytic murein transglycosylase [Patescibacteria group bacterium]
EESARIAEDLTKTEKEKKTLQNQISTLKKKVQNLDYEIKQGNIVIKDLTLQIVETKSSIDKISLQIEVSKDQISNILRTIYEEDQKSTVEILLEGNLSGFFNNLVYLESLNGKLGSLLKNTTDLKSYLETQQIKMDDEKDQTEKSVKLQTLQKQESDAAKKQQESLLKLTETEYQKQLKEKQEAEQKTASIRARIFELIGVPKAPTFGEAYEIAKYVASVTNIRPAFLLAILQQESAIGKNVGQCYLKNTSTGSGIVIKTEAKISKVMSPSRDVSKFLIITKDLGRDPFFTAVSCPMSFGWGGAMGPAQFIPSTWMIYKARLDGLIGKAADPWNIRDAFLAAGLYLSDYGAKSKTENGEWKAAMIYFSGSTSNSAFYWYANNVLKIARGFESDIKILEQN